jgi:hypothetical protein
MYRLPVFAAGLAGIVVVTGQANAADLDPACVQAVSTVNGKVDGAVGFDDIDQQVVPAFLAFPSVNYDDTRYHGAGSLSFPIGCMLGIQLDAAGGQASGEEFIGFGGHAFMRDPESYLAGVYATYTDHGPNEIWRVGPEVELYMGNFSIEGWAGFENSDSNGDQLFAHVDFAMYATDNLRVNVGFRRYLDLNLFSAGAEWQPEWDGLPVSFYVEGQMGEQDYATIFGGIRFYFGGPEKSLIRRHREDDPSNKLFNMLAITCATDNRLMHGGYDLDGIIGDDGDSAVIANTDGCSSRPMGKVKKQPD